MIRLQYFFALWVALFFPSMVCSQTLSPGDYWIVPEKSSVEYRIKHPFHRVKGVSHAVEGRAVIQKENGELMIRLRADSFDSGNGNRDAHAKEVLEVQKFPYISYRGKFGLGKLPGTVHVTGFLLLHGVESPLELDVPFEVVGDELKGQFQFPISLTAYKIERPALLFAKIKDEARIEGTLTLKSK